MAKRDYIQRFILIVELLRKQPSTFEEIQDVLFNNDIDISQRTFQRDLNDIELLYGIEINFNKKEKVYQVNEELADGKFDRIAESFNIVSALNQSENVSQYIFLEQRKPKGTEYFHGILHAIQNNLIVTFELNSFWAEPSHRRCVPKAIKEAQNRWYLIGYDLDREDFRNYGLDRISNFEITASKKQTPYIDVLEFYKNAFGIENYGEPIAILLEFDNSQKEYLKSLPFHHSQKIINETSKTFQVELFLHPTNDFKMEILKFGNLVEILKPEDLRNEVIEIISKLKTTYKINK